ncbi:MAG: S8 family serine peptidase [Planctomycetota bacterium]
MNRSIATPFGVALTLMLAVDAACARSKTALQPTASPSAVARVYAPSREVRASNNVWTNAPSPFSGANVNALLGADVYYSAGITGAGARLANVEAGHIWSGHETLTHVSNFVHSPAAWNDSGTPGAQQADLVDRHATWVASIAGGRVGGVSPGERQRGIAFGATIESGAIATQWNDDAYAGGFSISGDSFFVPYNVFFAQSDVINSSWGGSDLDGVGFFSRLGDALANENPSATFVVSAGNAGPDDNTVGSPGSAYNAITVGALTNGGGNAYDSAADFSSRGPQDWAGGGFFCEACRSPVDIAAPGDRLQAAFYGGQTGGNNPTLNGAFGVANGQGFSSNIAGTSFSSPIAAGAAALVVSGAYADPQLAGNAASRDARVVKAVLLNSAEKTNGWDNGQSLVSGVIETSQSLDYATGAGALDIGGVYDQHLMAETRDVPGAGAGALGVVGGVGWDYGEVAAGGTNTYLLDEATPAGTEFTVTLAWFRERVQSFLTDGSATDIAQVDLDLIVRDAVSGDVVAQSISHVNVVEHLHFVAPATSTYQIEVDYFGEVFGSVGAEQYGLAWSAVTVPEPSSTGLLLVGAAVAVSRRRSAALRP